jgi:hypothetical protein
MFQLGSLTLSAFLAAGCASVTVRTATRHAWACASGPCDSAQLTQDHTQCVAAGRESSRYVPWLGANGVLKTVYKDCMEKRGYTKARSDEEIRYQSHKDGPSLLAPGIDPSAPGGVDLILWF